jgi:endonuclease YncB( thermonuclease family)
MRKRLTGLCLFLVSLSAFAQPIAGVVIGVAEGDTLTMVDSENTQHVIRLAGIDAPDMEQPYGNVSRQHLADLAFSKRASADCYRTDRYGRAVCTVKVDGRDLALEQLKSGLAWWSLKYSQEQPDWQRKAYEMAQKGASADKKGLWRDDKPVPLRE